MTDTVLAQLAALKTTPIPELKQQWRDLFETEPPPYNRRFLESRLAYRIQELAYGGLKPETVQAAGGAGRAARRRQGRRSAAGTIRTGPIAGTRLIREWQGVEHCVTVRDDGFEYQGRPYKSLSAVARAITGTRWNGWVFFGLKNQRSAVMKRSRRRPQAPLRGLHPQVQRGGPGAGVQLPRCPARGLRGLRRQPEGRGLGAGPRPLRRRRLLRRHAGAPGPEAAARRHRGAAGSTSSSSTRSTG